MTQDFGWSGVHLRLHLRMGNHCVALIEYLQPVSLKNKNSIHFRAPHICHTFTTATRKWNLKTLLNKWIGRISIIATDFRYVVQRKWQCVLCVGLYKPLTYIYALWNPTYVRSTLQQYAHRNRVIKRAIKSWRHFPLILLQHTNLIFSCIVGIA